MSEIVSIYTDGSAATSDRSGGWAYVSIIGNRFIEACGPIEDTTVNVMELMAMLKALERIDFSPKPIRLFSDSEYAIGCITRAARWKMMDWHTLEGEQIANKDIVNLVHEKVLEHKKHRAVTISHVKGHADNPYNNKADFLAGTARRQKLYKLTTPKEITNVRYEMVGPKNRADFVVINNLTDLIVDASDGLVSKLGKALYRYKALHEQRLLADANLLSTYENQTCQQPKPKGSHYQKIRRPIIRSSH